MTDVAQASLLHRSLAILSVAAPLGIAATPFVPEGSMTSSVCVMLVGLWALLSGRWIFSAQDKAAGAVNAAFAIYALGSALVSMSRNDQLSQFEQYLPFLGAPLLGIGFRVARLPIFRIGAAFALGAIAAAAVSLYQIVTAEGTHRAEILVFSTWLGTAGALYAVVCGSLAVWGSWTDTERRLLVLGAASGVLVALLSGSKGSWLVLGACAPVFLLALGARLGWRRGGWTMLALTGLIAAGTLLPNSPVVPRIMEAAEVGGDRLRSAYWHEALALFQQSPFLGCGREAVRSNLLLASMAVRDGVPLDEAPNDAHNEYLDILAARGVAGLGLTLTALVVPFLVFLRLRRQTSCRAAANTGLLFIFAFAVAGLTDVQFAVNMKRMLYLFTVLFLVVAATERHTEKLGASK